MSDDAYIMSGLALTMAGFAAQITDLSHDGMARSSEESTHFQSTPAGANQIGGRNFVFGKLADAGTISITGNHDADIVPPLSAAKGAITIAFPLGEGEATATSYAFEGAMIDYSYSGAVEGKATFTASIKIDGLITITPAVAE